MRSVEHDIRVSTFHGRPHWLETLEDRHDGPSMWDQGDMHVEFAENPVWWEGRFWMCRQLCRGHGSWLRGWMPPPPGLLELFRENPGP